jgi:GDP-mannose 6-dehydrogenase
MRVAVFGLGYVGSVSAAVLASEGHDVVGVDINEAKVAAINGGTSPVVEPGLDALLAHAVAAGHLRATRDGLAAVRASDLSLICVGTPSQRNGGLDLQHIKTVCGQIGEALRQVDDYHVVVVRSTVLPGTTHEVVIPRLEASSGKRYGHDFGVVVHPEFLREGSALKDYRSPPLSLVGHNHAADARGAFALLQKIDAPAVSTSIRVAEMAKYASNSWHALKVCFANEIGTLCKRLGVDSHQVMDVFCRDTTLNISPSYLKPAGPFGGSCLPKDVRALQHRAKELDVDLPLLASILPSNTLHIERALDQILEVGKKRVALLGFSFKAGTDDLRESPLVILAESLLGKGFDISIYDRNVSTARLIGANKQYIDQQIRHLSSLLCPSIDAAIGHADVIVVGNNSPEFSEAIARCRADQVVIDLVRLPLDHLQVRADYRGICW